MRLFRTRNLEWCEGMLEALEEAVATGANSSTFQGQSVQWKSLDEAERIAAHLYNRIAEIKTGRKRKSPISFITVISRRGL